MMCYWSISSRSGRRYLFSEALKEGHFVKARGIKKKIEPGHAAFDTVECKKGEIYQFNKKKCPRVGLLDMTNYEACQFWKKEVIQKEIMDYAGASFWMAGE